MIHFEIEQLRRLPQRVDEVWQGGWVRPPLRVAGDDGRARAVRMAVWGSVRTGLISPKGGVWPAEEATAARLFTELVRFAGDRRVAGYRPGRVQVCDDELARELVEPLGRAGIEVQVVPGPVERLEAIAPVMEAMRAEFAADDRDVALSAAPGMTLERVRAFAEAAREYWLARPWERLNSDDDPIRVVRPKPGPGRAVALVLGAYGQEYGLGFHDSMADYLRMVRAPDEEVGRRETLRRESWSVTFVPAEEMSFADLDYWQRHRLPVGGDRAWPLLLHFVPGAGQRPPAPADVAFLEAMLRGIARATDEQLDAGRWSLAVPTGAGTVEVALELPELLESPSWQDMIARGWQPDRRAMERVQLVVAREFAENPPESIDEANERLAARFLNVPFNEAPFEPRTDWERAQLLCCEAFGSQGRRRGMLARRAREVCPDCADAWVILGEEESEPERALECFRAGVAAGHRLLDAEGIAGGGEEPWGDVRARGWLRALAGEADTLRRLGRRDEAIAGLERLLRIDAADPLGMRRPLLMMLLEAGRDADALDLVRRFPDDARLDGGYWAWIGALAAYRLHGEGPESDGALAAARAANRFVPRILREARQRGADPEHEPQPGPAGAARSIVAVLFPFWDETPGAIEWATKTRPGTARKKTTPTKGKPKGEPKGKPGGSGRRGA